MKLAVSACLLGEACRYDGASKPNARVRALSRDHELVPVCPECLGGLPTPRTPCEIQPDGRVVASDGADRTAAYSQGARQAVAIAREAGCEAAILKAKSPSCGIDAVYDGTFTRMLAPGRGIAAQAFIDAGFPVCDENGVGPFEAFDSRTRFLLGDGAADALARATVAVFGLGGVGSHCANALARAGVGTLILFDSDRVEASNINRQALAFASTVGLPKTEAARRMAADINPLAQVHAQQVRVTPEAIEGLLASYGETFTCVIDAVDDIAAKTAIALWAQEHGVPAISCMGTAGKIDATQLRFADAFETQGCPLCKAMRRELRRAGVTALPVVYSPEPAAKRDSGAPLGTVSYVPAVAGQLLAQWALRLITGA